MKRCFYILLLASFLFLGCLDEDVEEVQVVGDDAGGKPPEILDSVPWLNVPPGFVVTEYARVDGARSMAYEDGVLFVGTKADKVYAVVDEDRDYRAD